MHQSEFYSNISTFNIHISHIQTVIRVSYNKHIR